MLLILDFNMFFVTLKEKIMQKKKILLTAGAVGIGSLAYLALKNRKKGDDVTVVTPFDTMRYLGRWYEIARLDFRHEKNLDNTTAHYSLNKDNSIKVVNQGWNYVKEEWEVAEGKAKPRKKNTGALKVSFWGPFYDEYNVVEITNDYQYALVFGKNTDYMWILSREKTMPEIVRQYFVLKAQSFGYNTDKLVWPEHD